MILIELGSSNNEAQRYHILPHCRFAKQTYSGLPFGVSHLNVHWTFGFAAAKHRSPMCFRYFRKKLLKLFYRCFFKYLSY